MKELTIVNAQIASVDALREEINARIETLNLLPQTNATSQGKKKIRQDNSNFIKECQNAVKKAKSADKEKVDERYAQAEAQLSELLKPLADENDKLNAELVEEEKQRKKEKYLQTFVIPNLHGANADGETTNPESFWRDGDEKKTMVEAAADYGMRIRAFYGEEPTYSTTIKLSGVTKQEVNDILDFARSACSSRASFALGEAKKEGE